MLNLDMIKGILLSLGKVDFHIERSDDSAIGYRTRLRLNVRAESLDFIEELHRGLLRMGVESTVKDKEHSGRPKPILRIGGIKNLYILTEAISDELPDAKNEWTRFRQAVDIVANRNHLTEEGMQELFRIKGVL